MEQDTHHNDSIRLRGITKELEPPKFPFTTDRKEYRTDANSTMGRITRGVDKRKGILENISMKKRWCLPKEYAYSYANDYVLRHVPLCGVVPMKASPAFHSQV